MAVVADGDGLAEEGELWVCEIVGAGAEVGEGADF